LIGTNLGRTHLENANFELAQLRDATLGLSQARGATFTRALLKHAELAALRNVVMSSPLLPTPQLATIS
jgi:uncharacterized protein YjbI with pentapeptide repeats